MITCLVGGTMQLRGLDARDLERLRVAFRFKNPAYERNRRFRGSPGSEPEWIEALRELAPRQGTIDGVGYDAELPRGAVIAARSELQRDGKDFGDVVDERKRGDDNIFDANEMPEIDFLRDYQAIAVQAIVTRLQGMVVVPAGGGKTTIGAAAIALVNTTSLVVVPTTDLVDQFLTTLRDRVGIFAGRLDGSAKEFDADVIIATYESALRHAEVDPTWLSRFGFLLVDEAHAVPAKRLARLVSMCPARWRIGLSATPYREDEMTPLIEWTMGPTIFQISEDDLIARKYLVRPTVTLLRSPYWNEVDDDGTEGSAALEKELTEDVPRAAMLSDRLAKLHADGNRILVLGNRKALLANLSAALRARGLSPTVLTGDTGKQQRKNAITLARGTEILWYPTKAWTVRMRKPIVCHAAVHQRRLCGRFQRFHSYTVDFDHVTEGRYVPCPRCKDAMNLTEIGDPRLLLATSLADQGLDLPSLTVVVLAFPEKARGRTTQRIGRVMRTWPGKEAPLVIDVVDDAVPMFDRRFQKRKKVYERLGLRVRWEGE